MKTLSKITGTALLTAMGVVLPLLLHSVPRGGEIFLLMHIPVLLCGLLYGWPHGLACGLLTPFLSFLCTGMPPSAVLPGMLCELAVYGGAAGVFLGSARMARLKNQTLKLYLALAGAMLAGRLVFGAVNALILQAGAYSMELWLTAAFVRALPGIAIQFVLIPPVILALRKAGL